MPIYEYKCEDEHIIEKIQKIADAPITYCPICGKKTEKMISLPEILENKGIWIFDRKTKRDILHDR